MTLFDRVLTAIRRADTHSCEQGETTDTCPCGREASEATGNPLEDHEPTCAVFLQARISELERQLGLAKRLINRLPLCQDHRDKFSPEQCQACRAEAAERAQEEQARIVRDATTNALRWRGEAQVAQELARHLEERMYAAERENERLRRGHDAIHLQASNECARANAAEQRVADLKAGLREIAENCEETAARPALSSGLRDYARHLAKGLRALVTTGSGAANDYL